MSVMVGTGRGALAGVLIKNAEALETLHKVTTLVFDKTGTLTEGKPKITMFADLRILRALECWRLAASLESISEHPLAKAFTQEITGRKVTLSAVTEFRSHTGKGITGNIGEYAVALGNRNFMEELGIELGIASEKTEAWGNHGMTTVFLAANKQLVYVFGIEDPLKSTTAEAIAQLKQAGLRLVMLTGDNQTTANAVARELPLDEVIAEVLPDQKRAVIERLQRDNQLVAMAGDGINDAPALAQANVGIAMGTGTDIAIQSASITLVKGDLRALLRALKLSHATMRNIRQNLFFAFVYNLIGVPIAAGVLYPWFGLLLSPMLASAAMTFSSVSVITNALRLRKLSL